MSENKTQGGAGPALAAHSKDASASGQTPASRATGDESGGNAKPESLAQMANESVEQVKTSVREAAGNAHRVLSEEGGRAADRTADFVRQQPLVAVTLTGAICFALGLLLARR